MSNLLDKIYGQTPFSKWGHWDLGKESFSSKATVTNSRKPFYFFMGLEIIIWSSCHIVATLFESSFFSVKSEQSTTRYWMPLHYSLWGWKRMLLSQGLCKLFLKKTHKFITKYITSKGIYIKWPVQHHGHQEKKDTASDLSDLAGCSWKLIRFLRAGKAFPARRHPGAKAETPEGTCFIRRWGRGQQEISQRENLV